MSRRAYQSRVDGKAIDCCYSSRSQEGRKVYRKDIIFPLFFLSGKAFTASNSKFYHLGRKRCVILNSQILNFMECHLSWRNFATFAIVLQFSLHGCGNVYPSVQWTPQNPK